MIDVVYKDIISANNVYMMLRLHTTCLQRYILAEIVRCDLSFAKKLFECLLTMNNLLCRCCYALLNDVDEIVWLW